MKAARLETSARLQRVHDLLADGQVYTTLDIVIAAGVCAVNSCIAELRANGASIVCWRNRDTWYYQMTRTAYDAEQGGLHERAASAAL